MSSKGNYLDKRGGLMAEAKGVGGVNPVRNASGALNPARIVLKCNPAAEQRRIISNGVKILDGNRAAAYGILLSRPDVITSYPITPQTPLLETLYRFQADGLLDAEMVETEGENTSMSILLGASAAGGRTFTATSSQGLSFMNDAYLQAAGNRFPIVMVIGMREQVTPHGVVTGQQDAVSVKDHGWIQIFTESSQEILDSIIMAYRLAEDDEILLPVNVCYEGFYLSHHSQRVEVPEQEDVDEFLAPLKSMKRQKFTLEEPSIFSSYTVPGELYTEYRFKACAAQQRAKAKFDQIDKEFGEKFGRYYGGQIEEYRTEDAEVVIVTMGCSTGTAKVVIDKKRDEGLKVGLIKIRMFRPSPREKLIKALNGKKVIGVIDRNVCFGWNCGHNFLELKTLLSDLQTPQPLLLDFIGGLGGCDITFRDVERVIDRTIAAGKGEPHQTVTWLSLE
jgi:pyruvate/2-oxoacid:ferredoxin oxidoreductase alpha subunit